MIYLSIGQPFTLRGQSAGSVKSTIYSCLLMIATKCSTESKGHNVCLLTVVCLLNQIFFKTKISLTQIENLGLCPHITTVREANRRSRSRLKVVCPSRFLKHWVYLDYLSRNKQKSRTRTRSEKKRPDLVEPNVHPVPCSRALRRHRSLWDVSGIKLGTIWHFLWAQCVRAMQNQRWNIST